MSISAGKKSFLSVSFVIKAIPSTSPSTKRDHQYLTHQASIKKAAVSHQHQVKILPKNEEGEGAYRQEILR
jgi:hypothetical protein